MHVHLELHSHGIWPGLGPQEEAQAGPGDVDMEVVPVDVVVELAAEDVEGGHGHPKFCHRYPGPMSWAMMKRL